MGQVNTIANRLVSAVTYVSLGIVAAGAGMAQDQPPAPAPQQQDQTPHAWRRVGDAPQDQSASQAGPADRDTYSQNGANSSAPPPPPRFSANQSGPQDGPPPQQSAQPGQNAMQPPDNYGVPRRLTVNAGTFVTVRINQGLSSDHNQQGDAFFATLAEPIIVNGVVVAQRGQTVSGRVTEAQKAGRVEGTSKLGVELTSLTLVDGQQMSIQSQMINRTGSTSVGRDAAAIGGTTALGAAIGAGADWGRGAAIGAGAGAAAGIIGVLLTRGRPTIIYPESALTFRLTTPVTVETDHAPQAFRYVEPNDYTRSGYSQRPPARVAGGPGYGYGAVPAPPPYYYGPSYYPYYGGPGFSVYFGRPYYYGPGFYYRGYRR